MTNLIPVSLRELPRDAAIMFFTRFTRLFAYGALSLVLVFYLVSLRLAGLACATVDTLSENNSSAPVASVREAENLARDRNTEKE